MFPATTLFTQSRPSETNLNNKIILIIEAFFCKRPKRVTTAVAILRETNKPKGPASDNAPAAGNASHVPNKASGMKYPDRLAPNVMKKVIQR